MTEREPSLPPPVRFGPHTVIDYWKARASAHTLDTYVGVPISKFPEDLRVYEHLLWLARPTVVIELGVQHGGSTLWLRDRLAAVERYTGEPGLVIGIDLSVNAARVNIARAPEGIVLLGGDVRDPDLPERVKLRLPSGAQCMVIEDTAHTYETTRAALEGFAGFVGPGGFFVVEDGCVDDEALRLSGWPRGVVPALTDWLGENPIWRVRRDLELYGVTCHPGGFLQRG